MTDKFFPIKTNTSCQLKWTWSTIFLYKGMTNSCHRVDSTRLDQYNFDQFHNTQKKLDDRTLMLEGKWPTGGCEYCKNIEDAGGQSDRQFQLTIPNLVPPELDDNLNAIKVTPRILEIYLDNTCNMSCIYCRDSNSSKIQQENKKFGKFLKNGVSIENTSERHPEFDVISLKMWSWLEKNYSSLRRFHVLGGEPFFQKQFETCLDFLENHENRELEFNVVSNLKISTAKLEEFVSRIKQLVLKRKIKRFDLTASIDCWGVEQEYLRYGINLEEWQKNFEYLVNQRWIVLNINQTITGLGIKSMPGLIAYLNSQRKFRPIGHYLMGCVDPTYLNPGIFGNTFFDNDFNNILNLMPDDTWQHQHAKKLMHGLHLEYNTKLRNNIEIQRLKTYLDEIDRRRNLNWQKTFPWLEKEFNNVV